MKPIKILYLSCVFFLFSACSEDPEPNGGGSENPEIELEDQLPQVEISTSGTIVDEPKVNANMMVSLKGSTLYSGRIGIEFRGATSQQIFPKKSYGFETRDAMNNDLDTTFFDMPAEEDWILQGPYSDKSMMRNVILYDFAREMGHYAARTQFTELSIDGDYKGLYVLMEKLKRDKVRIDISKLNPDENEGEDLTGGYIIKIDKVEGDNLGEGYNEQNSFNSRIEPPFAPSGQIRFLYDYPDAAVITEEQKDFIQGYMRDFEDALNGPRFMDPEEGYTNYIDVESFIDFFILNELSRNVDGYRLSTFMYKDKNDKLNIGPVWDFNLAFGNANYCTGGETSGWMYRFNEYCGGDFWLTPFWWQRLLEDPQYVQMLKNRWNILRSGTLTESAILGKIDFYADQLIKSGAINKNDNKWDVIGTEIWPNNYVGSSYEDEVQYLKNWVSSRINWMDTAIAQL